MKKILILIAAAFWGCYDCEDCKSYTIDEPYSVKNLSGVEVELTFDLDSALSIELNDGQEFVYLDENRAVSIPGYSCGLRMAGCDSPLIDVKILFKSDPQKCLIFSGDVQDELIDVRVLNSYDKAGNPIKVGNAEKQLYTYVITKDLISRANPCE